MSSHPFAARLGRITLAALLVIGSGLVSTPRPTMAAPTYSHPVWCGQSGGVGTPNREYRGRSYDGHGWSLDIFRTDTNERGDVVIASAPGKVVKIIANNGQVTINHSNENWQHGFETVYAHMDPIVVHEDQEVAKGQLLGYISDMGKAIGKATAEHLHYDQNIDHEPQKVAFEGVPYNYAQSSSTWGPAFRSTHCPSIPAPDAIGSPFEGDITWFFNAGLTGGCLRNMPAVTNEYWEAEDYNDVEPEKLFCYGENVRRDEMAAFISRYLGLPPATRDYFSDDKGNIHEAHINRIAQAGITTGCSAGKYCPSAHISRADMAVFLVRTFGLSPISTPNAFTDDNGLPQERFINAIAKAGITGGCTTTTYCPNSPVTREQMAAFFHRGDGL